MMLQTLQISANYADLSTIEASDLIGVVNKTVFCLDSHIFN